MKRYFVELPNFWDMWSKLGLTDSDLAELETYLCSNPEAGEIIKGTGGVRKVRWRLAAKGKSGGVRTLYIDFASYEKIYLLGVYSKNEQISLSDEEKKHIKAIVTKLKKVIGE